ncbi:hypothetical protein ACFQ9X_06340 [Catenulispora yoronensis]
MHDVELGLGGQLPGLERHAAKAELRCCGSSSQRAARRCGGSLRRAPSDSAPSLRKADPAPTLATVTPEGGS